MFSDPICCRLLSCTLHSARDEKNPFYFKKLNPISCVYWFSVFGLNLTFLGSLVWMVNPGFFKFDGFWVFAGFQLLEWTLTARFCLYHIVKFAHLDDWLSEWLSDAGWLVAMRHWMVESYQKLWLTLLAECRRPRTWLRRRSSLMKLAVSVSMTGSVAPVITTAWCVLPSRSVGSSCGF